MTQGDSAAEAAATSPEPLSREAFLYPGTNETETMERYDPQSIEAKWQKVWADEQSFEVPDPDPAELSGDRARSYVVEMLPYPSGDLHMGQRSTTRSAT